MPTLSTHPETVRPLTEAELLRMPDSEYMSPRQLTYFRNRLLELREELLRESDSLWPTLSDSGALADLADRATLEEEQSRMRRLRNRERQLMARIEAALTLTPGEGPLYQSKLVSKESDTEYSHLEMGLMQSLRKAKAGSEAHILFNSSNGRWTPRYQQAVIALQLVSRTAGLRIGTASAPYVLQEPGDFVILGRGNRLTLQFAPIFWTEANAPGGTYSAEFRLLDLNPNSRRRIKPSGTFSFDFRVP
jgi:hypothetical protein